MFSGYRISQRDEFISFNNGSFFEAGIAWAICRMAAMGQRGDWPKLGRGIVTVDFLS